MERFNSSDDSSTTSSSSDTDSSETDYSIDIISQPKSKKQKKNDFNEDFSSKPDLSCEIFLKAHYRWGIENYNKKYKDIKIGQKIDSPNFFIGPNNEFEVQLQLYPKGINEQCKKFFSIYLLLVSSAEPKASINLKCHYKKYPNEKPNETEECIAVGQKLGNKRWLRPDLSLKSLDAMDFLPLYFDITIFFKELDENKMKVVKDLELLYDSGEYSDATLEVDDKKFKVHKYILAARSKVFAAMFQHDMKEKNESVVKIPDIDSNVMEELLKFCYCGEVKNLDCNAKSLLAAADKYDLSDLKKLCEKALDNSLNVHNVIETLKFADLYNSNKLKEQALVYIVNHLEDVVATPSFKAIGDEQSPLLASVITKLALNIK